MGGRGKVWLGGHGISNIDSPGHPGSKVLNEAEGCAPAALPQVQSLGPRLFLASQMPEPQGALDFVHSGGRGICCVLAPMSQIPGT